MSRTDSLLAAEQATAAHHADTHSSLVLANACLEFARAGHPDDVFSLLDAALAGLHGPGRSALWRRVSRDRFQRFDPSRPAMTDGSAPDSRDHSPAAAWERLLGAGADDPPRLPAELSCCGPASGKGERLALAVREGTRLAGAVVLCAAEEGAGREQGLAFGRILAEGASTALARLSGAAREQELTQRLAALERGREWERRWLRAVSESARGVTGEWELSRTLDAIVLNARAHLNVDRAALYRFLPDEGALQLLVGIDEAAQLDHSLRIEALSHVGLPLQAVIARSVPWFHSEDVTASLQGEQRPRISSRGYAAVPLVASGQVIGAMTADNQLTDRDLPAALVQPLALLADLAAIALAHGWKQQELLQAEAQKKQFYRDILFAVTNGKLTLCDPDEIERYWAGPWQRSPVQHESDIRRVREAVSGAGEAVGMTDQQIEDLCLCASEAATNALKHAGGGEVLVATAADAVRVRVQDHGTGIDTFHLPQATLMKGFSTRASMGLGFTLMHELADRLYLNTSSEGTTLVLEMALEPMSEVDQILARLNIGD